MDDTFASIVPLAFLSDNDLSDEEIEDIAEDEEEDFYDCEFYFIVLECTYPLFQSFLFNRSF